MESLPDNAIEWRERFPNGITWPVVVAAYDAGLMREERYLSLLNEFNRSVRVGTKKEVDPERRDNWRCYWEPKFKEAL
ncbi:hypothetical protein IGV50_004422 [Salmonella enterica subsp. enterica serovar Newport]|nr:hypothetical protein [Salmonella enterica subsp. enterica serovar Newport]